MENNILEHSKVKIKVLTPLHISAAQDFLPGSFYIKDSSLEFLGENAIHNLIPLEKVVSNFSSKKSIDFGEFDQYMRNCPYSLKSIPCSKKVFNQYKAGLGDPGASIFQIGRTMFLQRDYRSYIPGSSLKGALRSLVLFGKAEKSKLQTDKFREEKRNRANFEKLYNGSSQVEKDLLGTKGFTDDPFTFLKIGDFLPIGEVTTEIREVKRVYRESASAEKKLPESLVEMVAPGSEFHGTISFKRRLDAKPDLRVTLEDLFSSEAIQTQKKQIHKAGPASDIPEVTSFLLQSETTNKLILRLGRYQGSPYLTYPALELDPKTASVLNSGNSPERDMIENTLGWIELTFIDDDERFTSYCNQKEYAWQETWSMLQEKVTSFKAQKFKEQEIIFEKARIEHEQQQLKIEEEKKRKEELAEINALPEVDKYIKILSIVKTENDLQRYSSDLTSHKIYSYWESLDDAVAESKKLLAFSLREFWETNGSWSGSISKKQKEKVSKLKNYLAEE